MYPSLLQTAVQLAITACSPVWRGFLADVDCRWNTIADTMDDRTEEERGLKVIICCTNSAMSTDKVHTFLSP